MLQRNTTSYCDEQSFSWRAGINKSGFWRELTKAGFGIKHHLHKHVELKRRKKHVYDAESCQHPEVIIEPKVDAHHAKNGTCGADA